MMRDEIWREAKDLVSGDSLMPFYEHAEKGHTKIHLNDGSLATEHRYIYARLKGPLKDGFHIHHLDHDKSHNDQLNFEQLTLSEHCAIHSSRGDAAQPPARTVPRHGLARYAWQIARATCRSTPW